MLETWMCRCGYLVTLGEITELNDEGGVVGCTQCQPDAQPLMPKGATK